MRSGRRAAGFTLIELLTVVVIVAILVALGMPSMRDLIASTKVKTATSDVFASLIFARSEAIKRNASVDVVPVAPPNWGAGWSVRSTGTVTTLKVQDPITGDVVVSGPNATLRYLGNGRLTDAAGAALTAEFRSIAAAYSHIQMRCIKIDPSGRPSVRMDSDRVTANGCN